MIVTRPIPIDMATPVDTERPLYDGLRISYAEFLAWEPPETDGFKYEWRDGVLDADESIKPEELKLYRNIENVFRTTGSFRSGARMFAEVRCPLPMVNRIRQPDICIVRQEQIENALPGIAFVPPLVIEIISPGNTTYEVDEKLYEYFQAGVTVVWHILPNLETVRVFYSPGQIKVCAGSDVCDGGQAFPDFRATAAQIFAR